MSAAKSNETNPYASPLTTGQESNAPVLPSTEATRIRTQRLRDEANLKQLTLCLVAIFTLLAVVANLAILGPLEDYKTVVGYAFAVLTTAAALIGLIVNWGVRRFAAWSRVPLTAFAIVGLTIFPIGTIFGGLILLTVYVRGEPKLLSSEHEQLVKATPEMNERTSFMTWLAVALLVLLVAATIFIVQLPPELRQPI